MGSGGSNLGTNLIHNTVLSKPLASINAGHGQVINGESIIRTYNTISTGANPHPEAEINVTYKSAVQVVRHIIREEGYMGFLRGLTPRMLLHAPAVAISWTTYETVKSILSSGRAKQL